MQTYFFDVTDIVLYVEKETTVSGIQRVSLGVIKRAVAKLGADRVKISMWDKNTRKYVVMDAQFLTEMEEFDPDLLSTAFFGRQTRDLDTVPPMLARYRNNRVKYLFHMTRAHFEAWRGNARYFERRKCTLEQWSRDKTSARENARIKKRAAVTSLNRQERAAVTDVAKPGDQIIILGATWGLHDLNNHLVELRGFYGLEISMMIHDLIPLVALEHLANDFSDTFYNWLEQSVEYCTRYFANSQNTRKDLALFLEEIGVDLPIDVVPLAQGLDSNKEVSFVSNTFKQHIEEVRGIRRSVLNMTKVPYVLVVGTLETRKNIWRLAQAWQRLVQDQDIEPPRLIFAGKKGWYIDEFLNWMEASGNLNGWISIAEKPSDKELAFLLRHCEFTAAVSTYEGWGLPVGEGLGFGKTGVVARNSSLTEVGGDMVEYCEATSICSIYEACKRLMTDDDRKAELEKKIRETKLRSWDDVSNDLIGLLG